MSNYLGCESTVFAAIATVAGGHNAIEPCQPEEPVSVIVIHGMADPIIPYTGDGDYLPPIPAWSSAWAQRNQCDLNPELDEPYPTIQREIRSNCSGDAAVSLYSVDGGGHNWPVTYGMHATDVIWEFFENHPKAYLGEEK